MERCRDYFYFVVWFVGIGYALLWPIAAIGDSGRSFGTALLCGGSHDFIVAALCRLPHPISLPLGLHLMGFAATLAVGVRLGWRLLRRTRARFAVSSVALHRIHLSGVSPARPSSTPTRPLRTVKPRTHFGLRGTPH